MTFTLERDVAVGQGFPVPLHRLVEVADHTSPDYGPGVHEDRVSGHDVGDEGVAEDQEIQRHPLLTMEGGRRGGDAVILDPYALHFDMGAGGAEIGGGALLGAVPTQELSLERDRKVLISPHRLGALGMEHHAAVLEGPFRPSRNLGAKETVLHSQVIVGERLSIEDVPEPTLEVVVVLIADGQKSVLDPKCPPGILPEVASRDLDGPARQVLAIEQGYPIIGGGWIAGRPGCGRQG